MDRDLIYLFIGAMIVGTILVRIWRYTLSDGYPAFRPVDQVIKSKLKDNFCIDIGDSNKSDNSLVRMWDCENGDNQKFTFDDKGRLIVKHSNKCIDVRIGKTGKVENYSRVIQNECNNSANQNWEYDDDQRLHLKGTSKCIDIPGSSKKKDSKLILWDCSNGDNQKWIV